VGPVIRAARLCAALPRRRG